MALSLSADQKSLLRIFYSEDQFVIPDYQRPYSWGVNECYQLYSDVTSAFLEGSQDYFLGTIIIARAISGDETEARVVDGQQRLITLWLFFKCLSLLLPDIKKISRSLSIEPWNVEGDVPKIKSLVEERKEDDQLFKIWQYDYDQTQTIWTQNSDSNNRLNEDLIKDRFLCNYLTLFYYLKGFITTLSEEKKSDFWNFWVNKVYLLPIELQGATMDEAEDKAMTIFETINNRGLNLCDADIFKARLYQKAKAIKEQETFSEQWNELVQQCESLGMSVDDVFRYLMHIVRGENGITDKEKGLRDFFINEPFSPLKLDNYQELLGKLFRILEILCFCRENRWNGSELSPWLQIINEYSNNYPNYAIVSYLYKNNTLDNPHDSANLIRFIQSIIRYCFLNGATANVKFEIFNIIRDVMKGKEVALYNCQVPSEFFNSIGRLKNGYALLAHYLLHPNVYLHTYTIDKLIRPYYDYIWDWEDEKRKMVLNSLANLVVLDIQLRRVSQSRKFAYYQKSVFEDIRELMDSNSTVEYSEFLDREQKILAALSDFFALEK